jgi:hypothetical protein
VLLLHAGYAECFRVMGIPEEAMLALSVQAWLADHPQEPLGLLMQAHIMGVQRCVWQGLFNCFGGLIACWILAEAQCMFTQLQEFGLPAVVKEHVLRVCTLAECCCACCIVAAACKCSSCVIPTAALQCCCCCTLRGDAWLVRRLEQVAARMPTPLLRAKVLATAAELQYEMDSDMAGEKKADR